MKCSTVTVIKGLAVALALTVCFICHALDLPVKTLNGRRYYYYNVERNESVHGLSKKLGLSREQIVHYNPSVADGVRRGTVLYFPVEDFAEADQDDDAAGAQSAFLGEGPVPPVSDSTIGMNLEKSPLAGVLLPFGLGGNGESRQHKYAMDFYKGFLIAADTLSYRRQRVEIAAIEYTDTTSLYNAALDSATVIVIPEEQGAISAAVGNPRLLGSYIMNLFNFRDTTYLHNPYVVQAGIPADIMYAKACSGLMESYPGHTPVIIRNISGRNEKEPFTRYLEAYCDSASIPYLNIEYSGNLATADLDPLKADSSYVIVPSSGTLAEFNKFAYVVRNYRDSRMRLASAAADSIAALAEAMPSDADTVAMAALELAAQAERMRKPTIALYGYPDWAAFRSDAEELLHKMEVTIYSRFYDNYDSFDSRNLEADFLRWYGQPMIETVPSQALMGFDAGCYILKNMQLGEGMFDPANLPVFRGVQSAFHFERVEGGGYVNTALYIINYLPNGRMTARTL